MAAAVADNCYNELTMSINVSDGEEGQQLLKDLLCEQGLKVIEVYAEWAGRCNSVIPLLKRLKLEKDYTQDCMVVLHCKAESHELLEEYRGRSMPHFIFYRNGAKKAVVEGANMPAIEKHVQAHTPNAPDADDLEENPMLIKRKEEKAAEAQRLQDELNAAAGK